MPKDREADKTMQAKLNRKLLAELNNGHAISPGSELHDALKSAVLSCHPASASWVQLKTGVPVSSPLKWLFAAIAALLAAMAALMASLTFIHPSAGESGIAAVAPLCVLNIMFAVCAHLSERAWLREPMSDIAIKALDDYRDQCQFAGLDIPELPLPVKRMRNRDLVKWAQKACDAENRWRVEAG